MWQKDGWCEFLSRSCTQSQSYDASEESSPCHRTINLHRRAVQCVSSPEKRTLVIAKEDLVSCLLDKNFGKYMKHVFHSPVPLYLVCLLPLLISPSSFSPRQTVEIHLTISVAGSMYLTCTLIPTLVSFFICFRCLTIKETSFNIHYRDFTAF